MRRYIHHTRIDRHNLPPAAPLPKVLQTLGCRYQPLSYLEWCRRHLGPQFTVYPVDMPPLVFFSQSDHIRAIVTAPLDVLHAGAGAAITAPLFGKRSFLVLDEGDYLSIRQAITPAFHRHVIVRQAGYIASVAEREMSSWPVDRPFECYPRIAILTMRAILHVVFGSTDRIVEQLQEHLLGMLSITLSLALQEPRLRHLPHWHRVWKQFLHERQCADVLIADLIAARRQAVGADSDLLSLLLEARRHDGSPMSNNELRDNLVSVVVAGHETTASTFAWILGLLARHPHAQDRLVAEIDEEVSDSYMKATINEAIRHRPVFLFTAPRAIAQPIEIGGRVYSPPAHLLGCTYLMHHDAALFAEPHTFSPERFLTANVSPRAWLPWGGGRKLCPGRHLAMLELEIMLRVILTKRRLLPGDTTSERPRWRSALLTPHSGSRLILQDRSPGKRLPLNKRQLGTIAFNSEQ